MVLCIPSPSAPWNNDLLPLKAVSGFSPDSLPASCGALAPFRLCSGSQPRSSPWDPTSEAWASAPSPHQLWRLSRQACQAGECWLAMILYVGISPLCSLHPCCCAFLRGSKASPRLTPHLHPWRGFLVCGNFSSFTAPSQWCKSHPYSLVSVFSFSFALPRYWEFLAFWEVWGLLPAFSRCSVGVVPHVDVFLMYLWRGRWSTRVTPLPSWRSQSWFTFMESKYLNSWNLPTFFHYMICEFYLSLTFAKALSDQCPKKGIVFSPELELSY